MRAAEFMQAVRPLLAPAIRSVSAASSMRAVGFANPPLAARAGASQRFFSVEPGSLLTISTPKHVAMLASTGGLPRRTSPAPPPSQTPKLPITASLRAHPFVFVPGEEGRVGLAPADPVGKMVDEPWPFWQPLQGLHCSGIEISWPQRPLVFVPPGLEEEALQEPPPLSEHTHTPLEAIKRTYQPHTRRRKMKHGFFHRLTHNPKVLQKRRQKGRWRLTMV